MGQPHIIRQELKSIREKPPDTYLEDKSKKNVMFCTSVDPSTTKEENFYSVLCKRIPATSRIGNKYIYIMYVYGCNAILTTATNNKSNWEMIQAFTELTENLKTVESTQDSI